MVNVSLSIEDPDLAGDVRRLIEAAHYACDTTPNGDVWITDARHPLPARAAGRPTLVVSRRAATADELRTAWRNGALDLIVLPGEEARLAAAIERGAGQVEAQREMRTLRNRFIMLLVHDLRNPLSLIKVNLDLMMRTAGRLSTIEEQIEVLDELKLANDRALGMLQDLTDIHLVEDGAYPLTPVAISLNRFLTQCVERKQNVADSRELKVSMQFQGDATVDADPETLHRAVDHVLVTSMRHAPRRGLLSLGYVVRSGVAAVFIENNGPSLPPDAQRHIFDRYGLTRDNKPGQVRGIGLYLSRLLIEAHKGQIRCADRQGGGLRFEIDLPTLSNLATSRTGP